MNTKFCQVGHMSQERLIEQNGTVEQDKLGLK